MKTKQLILIFFVAGSLGMLGQTTGYLGKKFIIKTNLINGRYLGFNNCDVEYVVGRRLSLNASFQTFSYGRNASGVTVGTGKIKPGNRNDTYTEKSTLTNGKTKGSIASIGLRLYFNRIMPAPWGFYTEANLGIGSAKFTDYSVAYKYKAGTLDFNSGTTIYPRQAITGLSGKAGILFFEVPSFGYQKVFRRIITFDAKACLQGQYCSLPDNLLNALEHNYFVRSNTVGFARNGLYMGLAVYLKVGLLLF